MWHTLRNSISLQRKYLTKTFLRFQTTVSPALNSRSSKIMGFWLAGCSGMAAVQVILGGVTRLTESGLSMVDWKLVKGMKPPLNEEEWHKEFEKYKCFPEYEQVHSDFTVADFKRIFYMEYAHRMFGRTIGLVYWIPLAVFASRGWLNRAAKIKHSIFSVLLLSQGLYGWYMVKSGLEVSKKRSEIARVSQYRLAGHLSMSFLLFSGWFWTSLSLLLKQVPIPNESSKPVNLLRNMARASKALIFVTAVSGAFVAGLDAGLVYNSFPKMADRWIPDDILALAPTWKNFFENPTTVQFDHRYLGITTFLTGCSTYFISRRIALPPRARAAALSLLVVMCGQLSLGITTLLLYVPVAVASMHQAGALTSLSVALWLSHELRKLPK